MFWCSVKVAQSYPSYEDKGRGLWVGIYPKEWVAGSQNLKFGYNYKWWPLKVEYNSEDLDDFEADTDKVSAIIVSKKDQVDGLSIDKTVERICSDLRSEIGKLKPSE
jgi:hypothetical protein